MGLKFEGYSKVPADYAVDALSLEASRRASQLGQPYSYGRLIADTTREQREEIAENYRVRLARAIRAGRRRVAGGTKCVLLQTEKEVLAEARRDILGDGGGD